MSKILSYPINIENGDSILLAVSGGPDSMALLDMVRDLNHKKKEFKFAVAHVNHSLRDEADAEEKAIEKYCKKHGIPFYSKKVDLNDERYKAMTIEEAGREARYAFFDELSKKFKFNKLFTAHHLNDQVETILMRLIRGTGPEGLIGIKEESIRNNLKIIRPFLHNYKTELEEYCLDHNVPYFIDKSNKEDQYTRNNIRNSIIPLIEEINSKSQSNIIRSSELIKEQNDFIEDIINNLDEEWITKDSVGINIHSDVFDNLDALLKKNNLSTLSEKSKLFIKREIIRRALKLLEKQKDISKKNIDSIIEFFETSNSGSINLPNDLVAVKNSGFYEIMVKGSKPCIFGEYKLPKLNENHEFMYPKNNISLKVSNGIASDYTEAEKDENEVLLKSLANLDGLTLRNRQSGDYVCLPNTSYKKKLSRFMIDKKIPRFLRDSIPVLAVENKVIWIPEYYIHKDFIVKSPVEKVTKLSLKNF